MKPNQLSKKEYIKYLNETAPPFDDEKWIISGKFRNKYANNGEYGEALKRHDPIMFTGGYIEWVKEQINKK